MCDQELINYHVTYNVQLTDEINTWTLLGRTIMNALQSCAYVQLFGTLGLVHFLTLVKLTLTLTITLP